MLQLVVFPALVFAATITVGPQLPPCGSHYAPSGTAATAGMTNMVLAYLDSRSLPGPDTKPAFVWNQSMFETLIAPPAAVTTDKSAGFFDGVLFTCNTWFNRTAFAPEAASGYTTQADWRALLDLFLTMGAVQLDHAAASTKPRPRVAPKVQFMLSIPTPDPRAEQWGATAAGRPLNLTIEADRVAATFTLAEQSKNPLLRIYVV